MSMFSHEIERERRVKWTRPAILEHAVKYGNFFVSYRYRDDWLRGRVKKLRQEGLLTKDWKATKANNGADYFKPTEKGRERVAQLQAQAASTPS